MNEFRPGRFEVLPFIIKNLLIINVLCFAAQYTFGEHFHFPVDDMFALHTWKSPLFRPWQLVTHLFMHADFYHILGNMFALWMFGAILEDLWGPQRFLIFYFVCGLGAAFLHLIFINYEVTQLDGEYLNLVAMHTNNAKGEVDALLNFTSKHGINLISDFVSYIKSNPDDNIASGKLLELVSEYYRVKLNTPTIGASGAIFGVLAAFVYLFPNTYLYLYMFVPVKAKWAGAGYFAYELFFAVRNSAGDNIARWAHIGGAIVGLLIVITWNKTNKKTFY